MVADISALTSELACWELAGYGALAAVLIGVIGESIHEFVLHFGSAWWRANGGKASALILIGGLAAEGITQVKVNSVSGQIIALLNERAARFEADAARLRAYIMPWRLTEEQQQKISKKLQPYGKKPYIFGVVPTFDNVFLGQLKNTLSIAGWEQNSYTGPIATGRPPMEPLMGAIGLLVVFDQDHRAEFEEAADVLAAALMEEGIASAAGAIPSPTRSDPESLHIQVGAKPPRSQRAWRPTHASAHTAADLA
jgi:hypothetical protein